MTFLVHFRNARLWSNALLFRQQQKKVNDVVTVIRTHNLLDPVDLEAFCQQHATAYFHGFPNSFDAPNVFSLHELLDENWIGERVLDARAYQLMQQSKRRSDCPTVFTLPAVFHTQLTNAYRDNRLSKDLKDIRDSLLIDSPDFLGFVFNKSGSHWATCIVSLKERVVQQGDSLRWTPDEAMLAKLQWFLGDVTDTQGKWIEKPLSLPYQGGGSGSCGIVALNAIEVIVDPDAKLWSQGESASFRRTWLRELLLHHLTAIRSEKTVSSQSLILCND